jgi:hypothetical protein
MFNTQEVQSFKLVIRPGSKKLRSSDYWAILALCVVGSLGLLWAVGSSIS